MRSWLFRGLSFVLFFFLEVEVQAETVAWPESCTLASTGCTLQNTHDSTWQPFKLERVKLVLGPKGIVTRRSADRLHMVEGRAFVKNLGDRALDVSFATGSVSLQPQEEVFLHISETLARVESHYDRLKFKSGKKIWSLEPGFMVQRSLSEMPGEWSIPRSFVFEEAVENHLRSGRTATDEAGKAELKKLAAHWKESSVRASEISHVLVERAIASEKESAQKEEQRQRDEAREDRRLRELFRKKNYLDL